MERRAEELIKLEFSCSSREGDGFGHPDDSDKDAMAYRFMGTTNEPGTT